MKTRTDTTPIRDDEVFDLWKASRVALAAERDQGTWARLCWIARELHKAHPDVSSARAYKIAEGLIR